MHQTTWRMLADSSLSPGRKLDELARKIRLRHWRRRSSLRLRSFAQTIDLAVRRRSTDHEVAWQCFVEQQYEVPTIRGVTPVHKQAVAAAYDQIVKAGKTPLIVDCGANIGASAAWFKLKYPQSAVIAVEPEPDNCRMLRRNLGALPDVDIVEAGIGASDASAFLQDPGGGAWGYQTSDVRSGTEVRIVSIDSLLARRPGTDVQPFILKIDIEGAESGLFAEASPAFNRFPLIIVEPHDFCMPRHGTSTPFFKFHAATHREFLYHFENVFSFRMDLLAA